MIKEKKALAVIVGEAWAQRMVDKQRARGAKVGGAWPGRPEDVAILAKPLSDKASELRLVGQVILANARRSWRVLTGQPRSSDRSRKIKK